MDLIYKHEKKLHRIVLAFSLLLWLLVIVGSVGTILIWLLILFVISLFAQSGLISYLKGDGVRVTEEQMPEIYEQFNECCRILEIEKKPELFIMNSDGFLNALATRFLRKHYVVLYSGVVDALQKYPDGINFYIGHELGHIKRGHLAFPGLLFPGSIIPILGSAYARAQEYSSDLHGLKCCKKPKDAVLAMAVLAMGAEQWSKLNVKAYADQSEETGSFWMSFHELTASYPWLSKRMKHLMDKSTNVEPSFPRRSGFAWLLALFIPRLGFGSAGGTLISTMIMVAIIGILAAIAVPQYQSYIKKAEALKTSMPTTERSGRYAEVDEPQKRVKPMRQAISSVTPKVAPQAIQQATEQMTQQAIPKAAMARTPANAPGPEAKGNMVSSAEMKAGTSSDVMAAAKTANAMRIGVQLKSVMNDYLINEGRIPDSLVDLGLPEDAETPEIKLITLTDSGFVLHLRGDKALEGKTMEFDALVDNGAISWKCKSGLGINGCS